MFICSGCDNASACSKPWPTSHNHRRQRSRPRDRVPTKRAPAAAHQLQDTSARHRGGTGAELCR